MLGDDGSWYNCNDSHITKISAPDTRSTSAYVLFYVREWVPGLKRSFEITVSPSL